MRTSALVRSYANIADDLHAAGYTDREIAGIKTDIDHYIKLREIIRKASGETIDLKAYEADMRHLIDTYIEADAPRKISPFDSMTLLELIVNSGIANAINNLPEGIRSGKDAIAETIANNVRSKIIKEQLNDPAFYGNMSVLLNEIIADLRAKRIDYEEYLKRIGELAKHVQTGKSEDTPARLDTPGKRALYNNLGKDEDAALKIDAAVKKVRPDGWRGNQPREQVIKGALYEVLQDIDEVERIFLIIKAQKEY